MAKLASGSSAVEGEAPVAGWFSESFGYGDEWPTWELLEDGRWKVENPYGTSIWEGYADGIDGEQPVPTADFRCVELSVSSGTVRQYGVHVGVIQGASMTDVRWEAVWDAPYPDDPSASAHIGSRFRTWGNVIYVEQRHTGSWGINGASGVQTLTAKAYSGGSPIATLVFKSRHDAGW